MMFQTIFNVILIFLLLVTNSTAQQQTTPKFEQAKALFEKGNYEQASKMFSDIVTKQPNLAEAHFYLGRIHIKLDKVDDAADCFEKAVALCDTSARYHLVYGNTLFMLAGRGSKFKLLGRLKQGRQELERVIELDSENLPARYSLIQFYSRAPGIMGGDKDKAHKLTEEMMQINPQHLLSVMANTQQLIHDKKLDQAQLQLEQAAPLCKSEQDSLQLGAMYNSLGYTHLQATDCPRAIFSFKNYIALAPNDANAHDSLGEGYYKCGDLDAAIAEYRTALSINPDFKNSQKMLEKIQKEKREP